MNICRGGISLGVAVLVIALSPAAAALDDDSRSAPGSTRTVVAAIAVDRDAAQLLSYTVKDRPFLAPGPTPSPRSFAFGTEAQIEVVLYGANQTPLVRRLDLPGLCLDHAPDAPAEIMGDRIWLHHETFLVELPELVGFDQIEFAYYAAAGIAPQRRSVGHGTLDASHFDAAGGKTQYADLAFARPSLQDLPPPAPKTASTIHWPEEYGDPDIFTVFGDADETASRINVVVVPDGYTYAEKAMMMSHAQALVNSFRARPPFQEHDPFFNYILVYAYSTDSGTDQCDCDVPLRDTAFNSSFPSNRDSDNNPYPCGHSENRCLYYGLRCDLPNVSDNHFTQAELRAPAQDTTVVMVNTARYGGCGGARAVYSAANASATEVAIHELGHSLARLADEYGGDPSCSPHGASEVNTSRNGTDGAWPEWIADIGAPREGGQYYERCIFRPLDNCEMRSLSQPFCPVCNQRWALRIFGHPRVDPTAPIEASSPASPATAYLGQPITYSVDTRLAQGANVTNDVRWLLSGPGYPVPTEVATAIASHTQVYTEEGVYTLASTVTADTNFIKPVRNGANVDTRTWITNATCDPSCSPAAPSPATFECTTDGGVPSTDPLVAAWLDSVSSSASCYLPRFSNDASALFPSGCGAGTATTVNFTVEDTCGGTFTAASTLIVLDSLPPAGKITFPLTSTCFGPSSIPVTVLDNFDDVCDPSLSRTYLPAPGPSYTAHGDHHVEVLAQDDCGNTATSSVDFTVDLVSPSVTVIMSSQQVFPSLIPFGYLFASSDNDGASGGVVHESVAVDGCTIYDGATYGNGNGLLSDESLPATEDEMCRLARLCGQREWHDPVVSVSVTDCGGNTTVASRTKRGVYRLVNGRCP